MRPAAIVAVKHCMRPAAIVAVKHCMRPAGIVAVAARNKRRDRLLEKSYAAIIRMQKFVPARI